MNPLRRLTLALKAVSQLGLEQTGLYALYKFGLWSGHYRRSEQLGSPGDGLPLQPIFPLPDREALQTVLGPQGRVALLAEADGIAAGTVRLFGGEPAALDLTLPGKLEHWTAYETWPQLLTAFPIPFADIKFLWEPARFGWAFPLGRAFHLTGDERYAEAFWRQFESFSQANPPGRGPHWMSGQEVALRLLAFAWADAVFAAAKASTAERRRRLSAAVAAHARRIPPTLVYARSQHNNHLLSEAAGLLTAGLALRELPEAARWRALGWRWLNQAFQTQIDGYGEYAQHSTNYHRLMLHLALWTDALVRAQDLRWPRPTLEALGRATHWLLALMDAGSGRVPNLGANDGADILPLAACPFADYRPVLHAAGRAFLDYDLPEGPWDELALWLGVRAGGPRHVALPRYVGDQLYGRQSWAALRTAQFNSRPSHADQLHLDLWWRGLNVACDAGTYLYNAPPPWANSLTTTLVHNTVSVDGRDQFTRAGRFLYLDWYNAYRKASLSDDPSVVQSVRGRAWNFRQGYRHARTVTVHADDRWRVEDEVLPLRWIGTVLLGQPMSVRLHWLLPDWPWRLERAGEGLALELDSPHGPLRLTIGGTRPLTFSLARAGELLTGTDQVPAWRGWSSPTYGVKQPALSLAVELHSANEVQFTSEFTFPT